MTTMKLPLVWPQSCAMLFTRALPRKMGGEQPKRHPVLSAASARMPTFRDAHFNLARLGEQLGGQQAGLRHFNGYRHLALKPG